MSQYFDHFRLKGWQLWLNKKFPINRINRDSHLFPQTENPSVDDQSKIENLSRAKSRDRKPDNFTIPGCDGCHSCESGIPDSSASCLLPPASCTATSDQRPATLPTIDGIRGPVTAIPASDFARVFRGILNFHGDEHRLILKEYLHRSFVDILKHLFIPGRAQRACIASVALLDHGIPCPPVVALGVKRLGPIPLSSFLLTEEITDAPDIYAWITQTWLNAGDSVRKVRRQFIAALGSTIGRMHAAGIAHGDLRPRNILARQESGRWTFYLLDNERTRQFRRLHDRLRQKNLHQIGMFPLGVSRTDRWRFYRAYLAENPAQQANPKPLARSVEALTSARLARKKSESSFPNP
jgi:hypothetical protein